MQHNKSNSLNRLLTWVFLLLFSLSFLLLYPVFWWLLAHPARYRRAHRLRRHWAAFLFRCMGIRPQLLEQAALDPGQTYIFCANHDSYIDIPAMALAVPHFFGFMAKDELTRIPLFRHFFRTLDLSVDRRNKRQAHQDYQRAQAKLVNGQSLAIFPEGGIIRGSALLKPFKSGAFRLAVSHNIPVVPVSLVDTRHILPDRDPPALFPGRCRMVVHAPIYPDLTAENPVAKLREATYACIYQCLAAYHEN